jgi:hypothetical protein
MVEAQDGPGCENTNDLVMRRSGVRLPEAAPIKAAGQRVPGHSGMHALSRDAKAGGDLHHRCAG